MRHGILYAFHVDIFHYAAYPSEMTEALKKDRSPSAPKINLEDAIKLVRRLYEKAGRAKVSRLTALGPMGYRGASGTALAALGALRNYGLIDSEQVGTVSVSPLSLHLIHPTNREQEMEARRTSFLNAKVFNDLYSEGYHECSEEILSNHLIQNGFQPDTAKKVARVYRENAEFSQLTSGGIEKPTHSDGEDAKLSAMKNSTQETDRRSGSAIIAQPAPRPAAGVPVPSRILLTGLDSNERVLETYSMPLGSAKVTIVFTGEELHPEDFDSLADYSMMFKKQFERKMKAAIQRHGSEKFNQVITGDEDAPYLDGNSNPV